MVESPKIIITMPQKLIDEVDDFRFDNRFQSRAEAIRWLIEWALKQNPKP